MQEKFNEVKYKNDFARENYDRITVMVPKGKKEIIKAYVKANGYSSINEFINHAIEREMK